MDKKGDYIKCDRERLSRASQILDQVDAKLALEVGRIHVPEQGTELDAAIRQKIINAANTFFETAPMPVAAASWGVRRWRFASGLMAAICSLFFNGCLSSCTQLWECIVREVGSHPEVLHYRSLVSTIGTMAVFDSITQKRRVRAEDHAVIMSHILLTDIDKHMTPTAEL